MLLSYYVPKRLTSVETQFLVQVTVLDLGNNHFTGSMPETWGSLQNVSPYTSDRRCLYIGIASLVPCQESHAKESSCESLC